MSDDAKTILTGLATIAPWFAVLCVVKLICEAMR